MASRRVGMLATPFDAICLTKGKVERFIRYLWEVPLSSVDRETANLASA
jgi:hypothetical protein